MASRYRSNAIVIVMYIPMMVAFNALTRHPIGVKMVDIGAGILGAATYGVFAYLFHLHRRYSKIVIEPTRILRYRASARPNRIIPISDVDDLKAERSAFDFTRLIYLKNGDIVTYGGEIENVFDLDQRLMELTGLEFRSFQTGEVIDLRTKTDEIHATIQARTKPKKAKANP